jgi:hypothetical protein
MIQFTELVRKTIDITFNDMVSDKLMNAINQTKILNEPTQELQQSNNVTEDNKIITTEEELNAFYILKSILRTKIASNRIFYRDFQNYFSVILDDNNRKPICRVYLNNQFKKFIGLFDKEKKETK